MGERGKGGANEVRHNRGGVLVGLYSGGSGSGLMCFQSKLPLLGQRSDVSPEAWVLEVSWQSK